MNWDEYFVEMLEVVKIKSKDPNTKVAAIIVGPNNEIRSTGYNGFPRGFNDTDNTKWVKPQKYYFVEHAERNSIYNAARVGTSTENCRIYVSHFPCVDCARAIIQSGIKEVIISEKHLSSFKHTTNHYFEHEEKTREMFRQCKVSARIHGEERDNGDLLEKEDLDLWGV
jgi:dCMP deaminase